MSTSLHVPVAVVGMACLLPGADGLEPFWELLMAGRDAVVEMPPDRLDRELYFDERKGQRARTYSTLGGLVPPREPHSADSSYDVCHRLFCDVAREALESAGVGPLAGRPVGVFVGHSGGSSRPGELALATMADQIYSLLDELPAFQALPEQSRQAIKTGAAESLRQGRPRRQQDGSPWLEARWGAELLARELGLSGPNMVIDAACASSLVALALGALALERGDVELALVGGASYAKADSLLLFSQAQSCSASGTRPFDQEADGLIGAEGYVALVLKTEAAARRDGDKILAVLRGVGLSSDGRGRHLWAPQPEGQQAALQRAYGQILPPGSIQYIEAHATSTQVGDATEIESLSAFFGPHLEPGRKLPLGSVKSNLGHTLEAAGLAALLKVILAMQHEVIPPTANLRELNRAIDWPGLPLEVAREPRPWPRPEHGPRRAGVSAFGIGGLNVHVVVEEPGAPLPPAPPPPEEPIAIVGRGVVLPGAHDVAAFRRLTSSQAGPAPARRWPGALGVGERVPHNRGAFLTDYQYDYLKHRVPPRQIALANPLQFMLLDATDQALAEAGPVHRASTAVVVGTEFGGEFGNALVAGLRLPEILRGLERELAERQAPADLVRAFEELFFERYPALLDETGSFTSSTLASRITKAFDLEGGALALEGGECSSLMALGVGMALLRGRVCDAVVCAGAQHSLDLPAYETMARRGAFENPHYLPGEGVGVVLLKRLEDARRDGNPILGVLLGDGTGYAADDPAAATRTASARALQRAGLTTDRVAAVEPGNAAEAARRRQQTALEEVYPAAPRRRPDLMSRVGHLCACEGLVAVIQATLDPADEVEAHHSISRTGQASQVLLAGPPGAARADRHRRRLRLGAPSPEELQARLQRPGAGGDEPFGPADLHRLIVLAPNPADMPARLQLARAGTGREDQGVFLGRVTPTRVAFMFAGQGSQYHGMLQDLVERSPAARAQLEEADACLEAAGLPRFAELAWGDPARLDEDPVTTQVALLVADLLVYAALLEDGFQPDCVAGHSFGEIPAMVAARVLTLEAAVRITGVRARALLAASPDGGLLSVQASREVVRELLGKRPLYVTHRNTPEQTVVGGRVAELESFQAVLREHQLASRLLKVPGALHTPLVEEACQPLRRALERETLSPPTRLFYSNVTNDRVFEPEQFVGNLVDQIVRPVDYPALLEQMQRDGVGVFLEVGPGQVLTGLHRQCLQGVVTVASNHPRRPALEQLETARAALEVVGALPSRGAAAAPDRQAGAVVEFDATAARKQKNRTPQPVSLEEKGHDPALARLLIDFVVDLTGYPADVISLDWDLEADLGIDSIKRAQLVGEVGEALSLRSGPGELSLDKFNTLRQILEFLGGAAPAQAEPPNQAFVRGREYGREQAASIKQRLRQMAAAGRSGSGLAEPAELLGRLGAEERAELEGMAEGAGVHLGNLVAYRARWGGAPGNGNGNGSPASPPPSPTNRFVLRMVPAEQPEGFPARPGFHGGAAILGDNPVARALQAELQAQGVVVHRLGAEAPAELERLWADGPLPHLFLASPHDPGTLTGLDAAVWETRREQALMNPFWLCQKWLTLVKRDGLMEDATLVGLTGLGGDFGFSTPPVSFEGGALPGLLKAILIESWVAGYRHLPVKIVDSGPDSSPEEVVRAALAELALPSYEAEVALLDGRRQVVRPVSQPLEPRVLVPLQGRWVCTGGARGITAYVAGELGRRYGLELHLLGRVAREEVTPEARELWPHHKHELKLRVMEAARQGGQNPVKAWERAQKSLEIEETLDLLAARGIQAHYHACDISRREELARVLEEVRRHGPISGVLHGAGASRDAKFEQKDPARVDQCFRAKIDGTLALMELTRTDPLRHFVAFGSISGRFGANGHADYSLANDMEAKLVDWYRAHRPEVAAVTFHWHAWGDVGMATRAETQLGLQLVDMQFMPAAEGLEHLVRELEAGAPEAEVLITDDRYYNRFYPNEMETRSRPEKVRPLLGPGPELTVSLEPTREHFLTEHLLDGRPLAPLVILLELAAEALVEAGQPFRLRHIEAVNGLRFPNDAPKTVQVEVDGEACQVGSDVVARDGTLLERNRPLLRLELDRNDFPREQTAPAPPAGAWTPVTYPDRGSRLYHGPALRALRKVLLGDGELWGQITAPATVELAGPGRSTVDWRIPCAAMDACLYAVGYLAYAALEPSQTVPVAVEELRVGRSPYPRESCRVHVRSLGHNESRARFEFRLYGGNGDLLLEALGYEVAWLGSAALV